MAFCAFDDSLGPVVETRVDGLQIVKDKSTINIDDESFFRGSGSERWFCGGALKARMNLAFLFESKVFDCA